MASEATNGGNTELSETARRYDRLRKSIPFIRPPDILVVTAGLAATFPDDLPAILTKVKEFNAFTQDNDPWHEHDFGAFEYEGEKMFWKIDDCRGNEGYDLVLTVMLASEY
ncbi:MAG: DUF3768 domain-containing protein [Syntrophorhabdales bacterium]|jgi:hypothetical protein